MRGVIFGFGNMGQNHYERYKKLNTEIVCVIENDSSKRQLAQAQGIKCYETIEDYLKDNDKSTIDFIDICLPTDLHFLFLKKSMELFAEHPIPIIVEKPLVRTREEADALEKLTKQYSKMIFVAEVEHYNTRITQFLKNITDVKQVKLSRLVNKEYFLKGTNQWSLDAARSGGPILDLMIHDFSLLDDAFGDATLMNDHCRFKKVKFNCIDEAIVMLQFGKVVAEVKGSWLSNDKEFPIILKIKITDKMGKIHQLVVNDYQIRGANYDENDAFYLELKTFLEAIKTNQPPHSLDEYLRVVRLANDIISLAENKMLSYQSDTFKTVNDHSLDQTSHADSYISPTPH